MGISHSLGMRFTKRVTIGLILIQLTAFGIGRSKSAASGAPARVVVTVTPSTGSSTAKTDIIITGTDFAAGASVVVGGNAAEQISVLNTNFIDALIGPHAPGKVDVQVINADGQSGTLAGAFTYEGAAQLEITAAQTDRKNLVVTGQSFDSGSILLVNGVDQKTLHDGVNPTTELIGKKVGKQIAVGQTVALQVRNAAGVLSPQFMFTRTN